MFFLIIRSKIIRNKGDISKILETVILSRNEDIERFIDLIEKEIKNGKIEKFKKFNSSKKKIKLLKEEIEESEALFNDLKKKMSENAKRRANLSGKDPFDELLEKYGEKTKKLKR